MSRSGNEVRCNMPGLTISEKILARASHADVVRPGQIIDGEVDLLYMHEMLAMALLPFNEIGTTSVWDPTKIVVTLDHWVPPPTPEIAKMHQTIRDFCHKQGIQRFHDVGDHGIVHQLIAERGYAQPGDLIIGSDSHTNMVGAVGAFAAGIGATDTAAVMASGRLWLRVPETLRVDIRGTLSERTTAKDVILKVIGTTGDDGARYAAVEFTGSTVKGFPMNERFVLCNMTTEMGAKVGMIEADSVTKEYLARGVRFQITPASQIIYRQALKEGLIEIFMDAGATFTSSTCGPCFGGHLGTLAGDEVCISSTNRNYPGRMGSPQAQVYLASPWTVTASAIHGVITDPRKV